MIVVPGIKSNPYAHQYDCFNLSKDRKAFAIFADLGTGKGLMCLLLAVHLYQTKKIKRLLVVAPKGCFMVWAEDECPKHLDIPYKVAYWSSYQTTEVKKQLAALKLPGDFLRILVVNVEATVSDKVVDMMVDFMKEEPTLLVVDESTSIMNPQAKRTKVMINIGKYAAYRRICSGDPMPNSPMQLYSQTEFLQKNLLGFQNFFAFRNRFCVLHEIKLGPTRSFKKIVGYRDTDTLTRLMNKFSFTIKKSDCLDLPPKVYQTVDVEMSKVQDAAYTRMKEDSLILLADSRQVSAQLVLTQLLRLHQIVCGYLRTDSGEDVPFDEPDQRLQTLLELLEQAPGKVIIWATYRHNIKKIIEALSAKYGPESVVDYYGETSDENRRLAKVKFQDPNSGVNYIVSNPSTGKFGNTWTQASTVIYYSNSYDNESRRQSEDRAHRIGQIGADFTPVPGQVYLDKDGAPIDPSKQPSVLYIDLRTRGTVDENILKVLKAKKELSDSIVTSNWKWLLGLE